MAIEIVSFPINSMVFFHSYVSLPEGNSIVSLFLVSFPINSMVIFNSYVTNYQRVEPTICI